MLNKTDVFNACNDSLIKKMNELRAAMVKVQESIEVEEASTAGNKFETARAVSQEELDRMSRQMTGYRRDVNTMRQINPNIVCDSVQIGAIVKTDSKYMYVCIAQGKITVGDDIIFPISVTSPIGQNILGKKVNHKIVFGGKTEEIKEIL